MYSRYLMNMYIIVRIVGNIMIISVKSRCYICTIICNVALDFIKYSWFWIYNWVNLDSINPDLKNMRISPNGTFFNFFIFSFLKNTTVISSFERKSTVEELYLRIWKWPKGVPLVQIKLFRCISMNMIVAHGRINIQNGLVCSAKNCWNSPAMFSIWSLQIL